MEWDSSLDEMFRELDYMLLPHHVCDRDVVYECFKKIRDLLKQIAELQRGLNGQAD
jgi:hypothetical protein